MKHHFLGGHLVRLLLVLVVFAFNQVLGCLQGRVHGGLSWRGWRLSHLILEEFHFSRGLLNWLLRNLLGKLLGELRFLHLLHTLRRVLRREVGVLVLEHHLRVGVRSRHLSVHEGLGEEALLSLGMNSLSLHQELGDKGLLLEQLHLHLEGNLSLNRVCVRLRGQWLLRISLL